MKMNLECFPIIVICCYLLGEIYKVIFKIKLHKYIPVILTIVGGVLGAMIFYYNPEILFNVNNIWSAITIGLISGASSTGANQIINKIFKKEEK